MRWALANIGGKPIKFCDAASHAEAVCKLRPADDQQVEPAAQAGQQAVARHFSKSGPVLSLEDLHHEP